MHAHNNQVIILLIESYPFKKNINNGKYNPPVKLKRAFIQHDDSLINSHVVATMVTDEQTCYHGNRRTDGQTDISYKQ